MLHEDCSLTSFEPSRQTCVLVDVVLYIQQILLEDLSRVAFNKNITKTMHHNSMVEKERKNGIKIWILNQKKESIELMNEFNHFI